MASKKPAPTTVVDEALVARTALTSAALEMVNQGLHLVPVGAEKKPALPAGWKNDLTADAVTSLALTKATTGGIQGLALQLGTRSARQTDGGDTVITLALEMEGRATASASFMAEWASAADRLDTKATLARLDAGWLEHTPSGGCRWVFTITQPTPEKWAELLKYHLPAHAQAAVRQTPDGKSETYAELLTEQCVVAPSYGRTHKSGKAWVRKAGGPATLPRISTDELFQLVDLLGDLSDLDPKQAAPTVSQLDGRTAAIRTAFNRKATNGDTISLLEANGWSVTNRAPDGEVTLDQDGHAEVKVGGPSRPTGSVHTFSTSALPLSGFMWAFDVWAALGVDTDGVRFASSADAAEFARTNLGIRPKQHAIVPHERVGVTLSERTTAELTNIVLTAMAEAEHPTEPKLPWLVRVAARGAEGARLVTVTGSGEVRSWTLRQHAALGLAVVQPETFHKDAEGNVTHTYGHYLPPGVTEAAAHAAMTEDILPTARVISSVPALTARGTVLTDPGLHRGDGVLVAIPRRERALWRAGYKTPGNPTKEQSQAAADFLLNELLRDFPFETEGDRARAFAYLLTVVSRPLFPTAPGFVLDASSRGTGKTKLAALPRIIMTGSTLAATIGYSRKDDEEIEKRMATAALGGVMYLHVDELPRDATLTSLKLSELLTAQDGTMCVRLLGGNDLIAIGGMVTTVCGNNVNLGGDMQRRFIPVRLVFRGAGLPQERSEFKHVDLEAWTRQNRPALLAALHTVLAYGLQNRVTTAETGVLGSFEAWTSVVIGAMSHITIGEENAGRLVLEGRAAWEGEQDEEVEEWGPLMVAWHARYGDDWVKTSKALDELTGTRPSVDLPAVLVQEAGAAPESQAKRWGRQLLTRKDSPVRTADFAIYAFEVLKDAKTGNRYRVVQKQAPAEPVVVELARETEPAVVDVAPAVVVELVQAAPAVTAAPAAVTCDDADTVTAA